MIKIRKTAEFEEWFQEQPLKAQAIVQARLYRIESFGHFGDCKLIEGTESSICELRWKNGTRVYFFRADIDIIVLLVGGKKNDQKQDIKKAQVLFRKHTYSDP